MKKAILMTVMALSISTVALADRDGGDRDGGDRGGDRGGYRGGGDDGDGLALGLSLGTLLGSSLQNCADSYDCKQIILAKDDATIFVASEGQIRTAALDEAMSIIRAKNPQTAMSEIDIAKAIVAQK